MTNNKEYTEEEKKILDEFYEGMIKKRLLPRIKSIKHYMFLTHKKLDDIYVDIENKKSGLSKLDREFLTAFERSYINQLFGV